MEELYYSQPIFRAVGESVQLDELVFYTSLSKVFKCKYFLIMTKEYIDYYKLKSTPFRNGTCFSYTGIRGTIMDFTVYYFDSYSVVRRVCTVREYLNMNDVERMELRSRFQPIDMFKSLLKQELREGISSREYYMKCCEDVFSDKACSRSFYVSEIYRYNEYDEYIKIVLRTGEVINIQKGKGLIYADNIHTLSVNTAKNTKAMRESKVVNSSYLIFRGLLGEISSYFRRFNKIKSYCDRIDKIRSSDTYIISMQGNDLCIRSKRSAPIVISNGMVLMTRKPHADQPKVLGRCPEKVLNAIGFLDEIFYTPLNELILCDYTKFKHENKQNKVQIKHISEEIARNISDTYFESNKDIICNLCTEYSSFDLVTHNSLKETDKNKDWETSKYLIYAIEGEGFRVCLEKDKERLEGAYKSLSNMEINKTSIIEEFWSMFRYVGNNPKILKIVGSRRHMYDEVRLTRRYNYFYYMNSGSHAITIGYIDPVKDIDENIVGYTIRVGTVSKFEDDIVDSGVLSIIFNTRKDAASAIRRIAEKGRYGINSLDRVAEHLADKSISLIVE